MRLKILFFFIIISLFIYQNIFCNEKNNDLSNDVNNRGIEFNLGGSITTSFYFDIYYNKIKYNIDDEWSDRSGLTLPDGMTIAINLPISFIYNPIQYFGIGFMASIGFNVILYLAHIPYYSIENKLRIINKIGNYNNKNFLLLEYGISSRCMMYISKDFIETLFFIGPGLFIGYERENKKGFSYTIGLNMDVLFQEEKNEDYINYYRGEFFTCEFVVGAEFRWKYSKRWDVE